MADVWSPECIYSKGGRVKKLEKGKVTHERQNPPHNSRLLWLKSGSPLQNGKLFVDLFPRTRVNCRHRRPRVYSSP